MSIVHVHAEVTASDLAKQKTKVGAYFWIDAWSTTYPDDAMAVALAATKTLADKIKDVSGAGTKEVTISERRGFADFVITEPDASHHYVYAAEKATIGLLTEAGGISNICIPAPSDELFLEDMETVDPASAALQAFVTAIAVSNAVTQSGDFYKQFVSGYRSTRGSHGKEPGGR